jgi:hypothetical protein
VRLNERLARGSPSDDELFPGRPQAPLLGAYALLRANLAWAGGVRQRAEEAWIEATRHLPAEVLAMRDTTFSDVWPR